MTKNYESSSPKRAFTVCELFAGVGGFRLGLEASGWEICWSNQWEPKVKAQHASDCYVAHFGDDNHVNADIAEIAASSIPIHDLLVGGFPCQDYSVATTKAEGIHGKKGVLWWEIDRLLKEKRPPFVLLENVDRLLKSPTTQRGRDFGIMLACFRDLLDENDLGYIVEWRVINAADYGFPQRRRRVFILAYREDTNIGKRFVSAPDWHSWLVEDGVFAQEFPVHSKPYTPQLGGTEVLNEINGDLLELSSTFDFPFHNSGVMSRGRFYSLHNQPLKESPTPMSAILENDVDESFFVEESQLDAWRYAKGAKAEARCTAEGFEYEYKEGAIPFPDEISEPSRTILTSEGSRSANRVTHIIEDPNTRRYRRLTPIEVERLCGFPDQWTDTGMPVSRRYFCLGNSLVVGVIERIGRRLKENA
jgi:DNA (cytosine-5)-methyltransferase 1